MEIEKKEEKDNSEDFLAATLYTMLRVTRLGIKQNINTLARLECDISRMIEKVDSFSQKIKEKSEILENLESENEKH